MSRYNGEQVLVVPRAVFEEAGYFQGHREGGEHYLDAFMKPGIASFMDREAAENDPSHKQIIAYAIFCHRPHPALHPVAVRGERPGCMTRAPSA